jgi:cyclase
MKCYDAAYAQKICEAVSVPIAILGDAGSPRGIEKLVGACGVIGASAGSLFAFKGVYKAVLINYPNVAQRDELITRALGH